MAITLENKPKNFSLSKNPMIAQVSTSVTEIITLGEYAELLFWCNELAPPFEGHLWLYWADSEVNFEVVNTVGSNPYGLRILSFASAGLSWLDYTNNIFIPALNACPAFNEFFLAEYAPVTDPSFNPPYTFGFKITAKNKGADYTIQTSNIINSGYQDYELTAGVDEVLLPGELKIEVKVEIETSNGSGIKQEIGKQTAYLVDGIAQFDIQELVNTYLTYHIPTHSTTLRATASHVMKKVYLTFYEKYNIPPALYSATAYEAYSALKAGWSYQDWPRVLTANKSYINAFYKPNKIFLTRQPRIKKVSTTQQDFLYFLCMGETETSRMKVEIFFSDGTTSIVYKNTFAPAGHRRVHCFPSGFSQLAIPLPSAVKYVTQYKVNIETLSAAMLSEVFVYKVDYDKYIEEKCFLFTNSDGGVDVVRFTGKNILQKDRIAEQVNYTSNYPYDHLIGQSAEINLSTQGRGQQFSGFITTEQKVWLEDFFLAERKFEISSFRFIPINIKTSSWKVTETQENLHTLEFEYTYAFEDRALPILDQYAIDNTIDPVEDVE